MPTGISFKPRLMDLTDYSHISAFSVLIPLITAAVKRKSMKREYVPLIILLVVGGLNDLASLFAIMNYGYNTVNSNLYVLIEFILLTWMFSRWLKERSKTFLYGILICGILCWILDNFILNDLSDNNSLFWMTGSILLVYICIDYINLVIFNRLNSIIIPKMIICVTLLFYNIFKAFLESFHVFAIPHNESFFIQLLAVHSISSIIINLLFSIAFLCLPPKPTPTLLSSPL